MNDALAIAIFILYNVGSLLLTVKLATALTDFIMGPMGRNPAQ